nr:hypothetical protein [Bifidobacterium dentium]
MAKFIIPLETRTEAIELVLDDMAALQSKNRNAARSGKPVASRRQPSATDDAKSLRRRIEEPELGERIDAEGDGGSQKKT